MPYFINVIAVIPEPLVDSGDATLASSVIITNKVRAVFVDGIVGQMHALLALQECGRKSVVVEIHGL